MDKFTNQHKILLIDLKLEKYKYIRFFYLFYYISKHRFCNL